MTERFFSHFFVVLSSEGLFRLSADTEAVDQWVSRLDADPRADLSSITDPNLVAALLKRFLRLSEQPLLTFNLYEAFIEAAHTEPDDAMLSKLCACIMKVFVFLSSLPRRSFSLRVIASSLEQ